MLTLVNNIITKIPILKTIYGAVLQMTETFSNQKDKRKPF